MSITFRDRVQMMVDRLAVVSPALDTAPGSTIRAVIDAVAEVGTQADLSRGDTSGAWNFAALSGADLTRVGRMFGFERRPATAATGYVMITLAAPLTRDYLVEKGTTFYFYEQGVRRNYLTATNTALPKLRTTGIVPVIAEVAGASSNCRAGAVTKLSIPIENLIRITNEDPVSGGSPAENDDAFRSRIRRDLLRSRLGSEAFYRDVAMRHPDVSSCQLVKPKQKAEETLVVSSGRAESQEDSLKFCYPDISGFSVYAPKAGRYLVPNQEFTVVVDNATPKPPVVVFSESSGLSGFITDGDYVRLRYEYCSTASRSDPTSGAFNYLDLYVRGRRPVSYVDRAVFPRVSVVGAGEVSGATHPGASTYASKPYYVFVHQPVLRLAPVLEFAGITYREGRDYVLVKDGSENAGSVRARDALVWLTTLPPGRPFPALFADYYAEDVTRDVQRALDDPSSHAAGDDILVHAANEIPLDFDLVVEWRNGVVDMEALRVRIATYLSRVRMGSEVRIGELTGNLYGMSQIRSVSLGNSGVKSDRPLREATTHFSTVPLPDGSVPTLGALTTRNTAQNTPVTSGSRTGGN